MSKCVADLPTNQQIGEIAGDAYASKNSDQLQEQDENLLPTVYMVAPLLSKPHCGQKSIQLRLFISDAHIRDIRYRIQWGISIFSFTCHHLLRPRQILYFSQVFNTHFTFIISQFTKVTMKKIMTMMKIQQARVYYSK